MSILLQYANNVREAKGGSPQPVKYGQCYVFAAVVTTGQLTFSGTYKVSHLF